MKTVYKLFHATVLTLCSAIMLSSCDSFLDTKPYDFTAPETSGRDVDKFVACGLHSAPGSVLTDCPILEESPVNLECKVTQVIPLGSHDLFLAEVAACDVDESLLDENGKLCLEKAKLIVYSHGDYLALGKKLGTFGYSVRKKKPVRRKK